MTVEESHANMCESFLKSCTIEYASFSYVVCSPVFLCICKGTREEGNWIMYLHFRRLIKLVLGALRDCSGPEGIVRPYRYIESSRDPCLR